MPKIHKFLPPKGTDWYHKLKEDLFIFGGMILVLIGVVLSILALCSWGRGGFGTLVPEEIMRTTIPAVTLIAIGVQSIFSGFVMSIIKVKEKKNKA